MTAITSSRIIVCDDSVTNTAILSSLLNENGFIHVDTFNNPLKALQRMEDVKYDLMLLDLEMPNLNGLELVSKLKTYGLIDGNFPILMLTGVTSKEMRNKALKQGILDYINKPLDFEEVILRVNNALKFHLAYKQANHLSQNLEQKVDVRTKELDSAKYLLTKRLAEVGELKDNDTGRHVERVGRYAQLLAKSKGLPSEVCHIIEYAAQLHDLGKVAIPDSILLKPDKLTKQEWHLMKTHTVKGSDLLKDIDSDIAQMASSITMHHHENWDGTGYPKSLSGESIPIEARIVAICDVFDALCSKRSYKDPWSFEQAFDEIIKLSGTKFEPELVNIFKLNKAKINKIYTNLIG